MQPGNVPNFRKTTVTKKNKKKTKNNMHTSHHTISHKHTYTTRVKNKQKTKISRLQADITRPLASMLLQNPENNYQSNVHAYFTFLLPLDILFHALTDMHHPASAMTCSYSVSLHNFIR